MHRKVNSLMKGINELINRFIEYLLASDLKEHIAKIILFGSYAKGANTIDSDIDLLILTSDGISIDKYLMDQVYDFIKEIVICGNLRPKYNLRLTDYREVQYTPRELSA